VLGEVIRRDRRDVKDRYYRFRLPFDCSAPLLGGFLVVTGALIVHVLFDKRYADAGPLIQIMGISLLIYPSLLIGPVFTANGEPYVAALISVIRAIALVSFTTVGFLIGGLVGAVGGMAIHTAVPATAYLYMGRRRHWVNVLKELRVIPLFAIGAVSGEIVLVIAKAINFPFH
jgi:O-antigen/teichoic acid export membrane protein